MTVEKLNTLFETPAHVRISSQQYIDDPRSEQKSDLIEGVFVMASPASYLHEDLVIFLIGTLATYVTARKLGKVLGSNAAFELSEDNVYQPDISFILAERLYLASDVYFPGPPDIAIEIISPSSRNYDTVEKKINYARYGVQEYWLIDPIHEQATFYTRVGDQFSAIAAEDNVLRSQLLAGFWLRLDWLFPPEGEDRPSLLDIAGQQGLLA
jgi:Uma2 family endonuclease